MKNKLLLLLAFLVPPLVLTDCTENSRTKKFGGNQIINLPKNTKFVNVSWKEGNIWYTTRPLTSIDTAETFTYHEKSSYGLIEGAIKFVESK